MSNRHTFRQSRPRTSSLQALQRFLTEKEQLSSKKNTDHLFESLYPLLNNLPNLNAITYSHLDAAAKKLWVSYSAGSIRSKLTDWKTFFRWCHSQGLIERNPTHNLKLPRPRPRNKAANEDHITQVINHLARQLSSHIQRTLFGPLEPIPGRPWLNRHTHALRDLLLLVLIYETGARAGEIATLTTRQMQDALAHPVPLTNGKAIYRLQVYGKTGEHLRTFTQATADLYQLWEQTRPRTGRDYVFVNWRKRGETPWGLSSEAISKIIVRRCNQANVTIFRAHSIRHAKAHRAKKQGGIEMAMAILDHSDITSTLFYTGEDEHSLNAAAYSTGLQITLF